MSHCYHLTTSPVALSLGRKGRATVLADVPFIVDGVQHCAGFPHVMDLRQLGQRSGALFMQALNAAREGRIRVWRNG